MPARGARAAAALRLFLSRQPRAKLSGAPEPRADVQPARRAVSADAQRGRARAGAPRDGRLAEPADGRLLLIGWVRLWLNVPGVNVFHAGNAMSLVRDVAWDAGAGMLRSYPVREYASLHNATFLRGAKNVISAGSAWTLPIAQGKGGALDILLSFDLSRLGKGERLSGFGIAARAPVDWRRAAFVAFLNVSAQDRGSGERTVELTVNGNVSAVWLLLAGESLELRVLVDRPIVEVFGNGGRGAFVFGDTDFELGKSLVHLFNAAGGRDIEVNASAFGMACGWSAAVPVPVPAASSRSQVPFRQVWMTASKPCIALCQNSMIASRPLSSRPGASVHSALAAQVAPHCSPS